MQPPKRQIIKTRSQRPYVIARVIIIIIVALLVAAAIVFLTRPHPAHAQPGVACVRALQEHCVAARTALVQAPKRPVVHADLR